MMRFSKFILLASLSLTLSARAANGLSPPPLVGHPFESPVPKAHAVHQTLATTDRREGGETIEDAQFVETLPFLDLGNTCSHLDDYDEACPYSGSTSPDVVYVYVPPEDHLLTIDLCGSQYDTKVFVYEGAYTPGAPVACNDDYYRPDDPCGAWVSRIDALPVTAGVPYFIVVDGWGGDCGDYQLRIDHGVPPPQFDITFSQLTFGYEGFDDVTPSSIGRVRFDFQVPPEQGFLNMAAFVPGITTNAEWIVRNQLIPGEGMGPPVEAIAVRFPMAGMAISNGVTVPNIAYAYTITPDPLNDADVTAWSTTLAYRGPVPVEQQRVESHGFNAPGPIPDADLDLASWWLEYVPPLQIIVNSFIGCDMPNVQLDSMRTPADWNGCGPAACANSLSWLKLVHPEIDFPPDLRDTYEQLSNLMNRLAGEGVGVEDVLKAKLDFIEAYGLPIHVKYQARAVDGDVASSSGESHATDGDGPAGDYPDRNWIETESAHGEDVELGVGFYYYYNGAWHRDGGHAVVVTGTGTVNGVPTILYKHDTAQADSTGTEQEASDIDELDDGTIHLPGLDGFIIPEPGADPVPTLSIVEAAFSESFDDTVAAVPDSVTYHGYCEWFKRTIPPGGKLRVTFGGGYSRCQNVTVYRLDRTVDPPQWVKVEVWNNNNGETREWVNPYDYPVTIAVHNDDDYEYQGEYVPNTLGVEVIAASSGDTSSPSNEDAYGGFSMGGTDGSDGEFGSPAGPDVTIDASLGVNLSQMPRRLSDAPTGVQSLTLTYPIPVWNPYWENLGVAIRIASVTSPGDLIVSCPTTGDTFTVPITDTSPIDLTLTSLVPTTQFSLVLQASGGVDVFIDFVGVPSLTPYATAVPGEDLPTELALAAAQPNPFNPVTKIRFALPADGEVTLAVYDITGRLVTTLVHGMLPAGRHEAVWLGVDSHGRAAATGVYLYRLDAGGKELTGKMTMIR